MASIYAKSITAKPLKAPKKAKKELDEDDLAHKRVPLVLKLGSLLTMGREKMKADAAAKAQLAATVRLDSVSQVDFDTVFYPGGHGPMCPSLEIYDLVQPLNIRYTFYTTN